MLKCYGNITKINNFVILLFFMQKYVYKLKLYILNHLKNTYTITITIKL